MTLRRGRRGLLLVALMATLAATTAGLARWARRRRLGTPPSLDTWPAVPRAPHKAGG